MILNLTQHVATPEQRAQGVVEVRSSGRAAQLKNLLNFNELPTAQDIKARAQALVQIAFSERDNLASEFVERSQYETLRQADFDITHVMIGGAPYLMGALEQAFTKTCLKPLYSFSRRESAETVNADGSVSKTAVFRHCGWVEV
jgi:hypothetical protein